ncbi:MAG: SRPBCC family protein [Pirellulaceae bacterium]
MPYLVRLWFGVREPVGQATYAASGFGLMLLKYAVEALAIWMFAAQWFPPWQFLNPVLTMRMELLQPGPPWLGWALFVWSLPFLWIAITMSVRRAADAGASPWAGMLVLVPLVNLVIMPVMCLMPRGTSGGWSPRTQPARSEDQARSGALALGGGLMVGGAMMAVSVYALNSYGAALFVGTPLMMGVVSGYLFNRNLPRSYAASMGLGLATMGAAGLALLLFALEGVICVAMALPLVLPLGLLGGIMGKAIADASRRPPRELLALVVLLPVWATAESLLAPRAEHEVLTAVEIDAPPQVVWEHVIRFPELPPPTEWHFRLGIAAPQRARIEGAGVGAIRYCEFTTGQFVEPITVWQPGRRLAFDVTEQPEPMFELSPYRHVHPPHLEGALRSKRGEFRLIALSGGRTRLEGRTWYELEMFPSSYWTLWTQVLIGSIHERVLQHVKQLAEEDSAAER